MGILQDPSCAKCESDRYQIIKVAEKNTVNEIAIQKENSTASWPYQHEPCVFVMLGASVRLTF